MNPPQTSFIHRIAKLFRLGCMILSLLSTAQTCYAYEYVGNGIIVTTNDTIGTRITSMGTWAIGKNTIIAEINTEKRPRGCTTQSVISPTPELSAKALRANNYAEAKRKIAEAVGMFLPWRSNMQECQNLDDLGQPISVRVCITSLNESAGYPGVYDDICMMNENPTPEPDPTECHATIRDVPLGVLSPGEAWVRRQTTLSVTCDRDAAISVSVNGGRDLEDAETGSQIKFEYDKSHACHTCVVPVWVNMVRAPYEAGSYSWGVPVVVDYN